MSNISAYVDYQNAVRAAQGLPATWDDSVGISTDGKNSVIGWAAGTTNLPSGFNTILLDLPRVDYAIQIDGTGQVVIKDIGAGDPDNGKSMTVNGATYLIFNGGSAGAPGIYDQAMFVDNGPASQIARLYQITFGRQPDLPGLEQWVAAYNAGTITMTQIENGFLSSGEFAGRYGSSPSNQQFITNLYQANFGETTDTVGINGWISALNAGAYSRAGVLDAFASSLQEATITGSWLADTSKGGYADSGLLLSANTVFTQAVASHYLDMRLIDHATLTYGAHSSNYSSNGLHFTGYSLLDAGYNYPDLVIGENGSTIVLSDFSNISEPGTTSNTIGYEVQIAGSNNIVYNSKISFPTNYLSLPFFYAATIQAIGSNNSVFLTNNTPTTILIANAVTTTSAPTTNTTIYYYTPGTDRVLTPIGNCYENQQTLGPSNPYPSISVIMLDASHGQTFDGTSLDFAHSMYVLKLGNVGTGSPEEVADAINHAYTLAERAGTNPVPGTGPLTTKSVTLGENLTIIGQAGTNTVVYQFASSVGGVLPGFPTANPDLNGNHLVDANEISLLATLVGINASNLTPLDFR